VAVVIGHADAGGTVQVANDFDLVGWCAYVMVNKQKLLDPKDERCIPMKGFPKTTWKPSPAGCGATIRGMFDG
jgi:hypothetical protein